MCHSSLQPDVLSRFPSRLFQACGLALHILEQPLRRPPLLPEAQSLLRISGKVSIIPLSLTCTTQDPRSGLNYVLLIVKLILLFPPSFPWLFVEGLFIFPCFIVSLVKTACLETSNCIGSQKIKFSKRRESTSLVSVSL